VKAEADNRPSCRLLGRQARESASRARLHRGRVPQPRGCFVLIKAAPAVAKPGSVPGCGGRAYPVGPHTALKIPAAQRGPARRPPHSKRAAPGAPGRRQTTFSPLSSFFGPTRPPILGSSSWLCPSLNAGDASAGHPLLRSLAAGWKAPFATPVHPRPAWANPVSFVYYLPPLG
jgi:hypothetical protein